MCLGSVTGFCPILCYPMNHSTPGPPIHHQLPISLKLTSIESVMPSGHFILCHPLLLLPPIPPSMRVFSNESTLHMRWPKYWSFSWRVMVERSDRMWSTGEGNGKPLQYSCLENPMNSMKRQNDSILKEELPRSVGAQCATGDHWKNNSRKNEGMKPGKNNTQLWM